MHVLSIGYGRHFFKEQDPERLRLQKCAESVESLHMVIFTLRSERFVTTENSSGLALYPTQSRTRFHMVFDAIRIGMRIIKETPGTWVVTAQDPFETGIVGSVISRLLRVPFNVQEHGDFFSTAYWRQSTVMNRMRYFVGTYVLGQADTVRVVSQRIRNTLQKLGVSTEKIVYLPVRSDAITGAASRVDLHALYPDASVIVLSMGRLVAQKNIPLLLRSFVSVHAEDPKALLVVVGTGEELPELKQMAERLKINTAVVFLPWTDTPQDFMRSADIFVLSSDWEGWGRVLVEAMAAGTPAVSTGVGCAGEVFIDGKHGFVVGVRDEEAFAQRLIQLASNPTLRAEFGDQARQDIKNTHVSIEDYVSEWVKVLETTATHASDK